jgi:hypothetical protein
MRSKARLLGLILLGVLVSAAAAQQGQTAHPQYTAFIGAVDSITAGDAANGTKAQVVVVAKDKASKTFLILPSTKVVDAKGVAIALDKIRKGAQVNVRYATRDQGDEALRIRLLK